MKRTPIAKSQRLRIYAEGKGICASCENFAADYEIDHVVPMFLGGTNEDSNLQVLCKSCHKRRSRGQQSVFAKTQRLAHSAPWAGTLPERLMQAMAEQPKRAGQLRALLGEAAAELEARAKLKAESIRGNDTASGET